ncbi:acetyl-CoA carboxylase biotin carboxyl carrier protein [Sediminibacillus massiliensis]|uniref:acetyl-CoA carboxylase biotin carboxyl carrier protein n=1 Tax=Sediminibacillus massiliensis TaxID=1926277 RepID=UPI0009885DE9|nr:acetyl-CoA carboxylase biotin carboxyl carrier protein [Sediminibacillus massiliensis]
MLKVQEIRELIKLIDQSSIDEFSYESNGTKVSMKKEKGERVQAVQSPANIAPAASEVVSQPSTEPVEVESTPEPQAAKPAEKNAGGHDHEIVSPMVGTFYSSPTPESDVYVQKGDKVSSDTVVCIVEAMKLFNEIEAEVKGEITEVLVEDGELVEYGQPLFRVKTE